MQFTTGGPGPDIDLRLETVPGNNVWGSLPSARSAQQVAEALHALGWRSRKSSWTEFEVATTYAELEVRPEAPVQFSGVVVPERIDELLAAFAELGFSFSVELGDSDGGELATFRSEGQSSC